MEIGFGGGGMRFGRGNRARQHQYELDRHRPPPIKVDKTAVAVLAEHPALKQKTCRKPSMQKLRPTKSRPSLPNCAKQTRPRKPSWKAAQEDLRKMLTARQEATAVLGGLLK